MMVCLLHASVACNFTSIWKATSFTFLFGRSLRTTYYNGPSPRILFSPNFFSFVFQICTEARMWRVCVCCNLDSSRTKQRRKCGRISTETIYSKDNSFQGVIIVFFLFLSVLASSFLPTVWAQLLSRKWQYCELVCIYFQGFLVSVS